MCHAGCVLVFRPLGQAPSHLPLSQKGNIGLHAVLTSPKNSRSLRSENTVRLFCDLVDCPFLLAQARQAAAAIGTPSFNIILYVRSDWVFHSSFIINSRIEM